MICEGCSGAEIVIVDDKEKVRNIWFELAPAFTPPLQETVGDIEPLVAKLARFAVTLACYRGESLLGAISFYCNDKVGRVAFVSEIATAATARGLGVGRALMDAACGHARQQGMNSIRLEVRNDNDGAMRFYRKYGFVRIDTQDNKSLLAKQL